MILQSAKPKHHKKKRNIMTGKHNTLPSVMEVFQTVAQDQKKCDDGTEFTGSSFPYFDAYGMKW